MRISHLICGTALCATAATLAQVPGSLPTPEPSSAVPRDNVAKPASPRTQDGDKPLAPEPEHKERVAPEPDRTDPTGTLSHPPSDSSTAMPPRPASSNTRPTTDEEKREGR
jgi:hypothetical protein